MADFFSLKIFLTAKKKIGIKNILKFEFKKNIIEIRGKAEEFQIEPPLR